MEMRPAPTAGLDRSLPPDFDATNQHDPRLLALDPVAERVGDRVECV
jgi:hypothetical protein